MEAAIGTNLLDRNNADRLLAETNLPSLRDPGGVSEGKLGDKCGRVGLGRDEVEKLLQNMHHLESSVLVGALSRRI